MEMGVDHHHHVIWGDANLSQPILEHRRPADAFVLEAIDVLELVVLLIAGAGVNEDKPGRVLDQQTAHAELDAIALVGRYPLLPEGFRDDAKHRAAVQLLTSGLNRVDGQRANLAALN